MDDFVTERVNEHGDIFRYDDQGDSHSLHQPAAEWADGTKLWHKHGELHREDGPAIEFPNYISMWYYNGSRHRLDGPAIEWANGTKKWYINGELIGSSLDGFTDEDFENYKKNVAE